MLSASASFVNHYAILSSSEDMVNELFLELAGVILIAGVLALIAQRLRQPLIIAYILTGVLVGPGVLALAHSTDIFTAMSQIGIAFLLFIVGLNLDWRRIKDVGRVALLAGIAQVVCTSLVGFGIGRLLHFPMMTSLFVAIAFSFSSTIIIVKLLSDKEDLDRLYGRIAVGMLIVQDLVAMFILLLLATMGEGGSVGLALGESALKGLVVLVLLAAAAHTVLPRIFRYAAQSQELLFLATIAWCFGLAALLQTLGFGIEIGALLAGISLAGGGYQHEIEGKIRWLRDFFLVMFFIMLGTQLTVSSFHTLWVPAVIMSAYVIVGNPLIAMLIMRFMGYHPRAAFLTGTTVGQISEFSFILLAAAIAAGLAIPEVLPLATIVALVTITVSSYIVMFNERIYDRFSFLFTWMVGKKHPTEFRRAKPPTTILFGFNRMGKHVYEELREVSDDCLIVDYNPAVLQSLADDGVASMYGDAGSDDVLHFIHAEKAKMIVSTIPDAHVNCDILDYLASHRSRAIIIVTVRNEDEAKKCYAMGASYVIIPSVLGGEAFGQYLKQQKLRRGGWQSLAKRHMKHVMRSEK